MKLIAHRGNISGINSDRENSPEYIEESITFGFESEVDVWYNEETKELMLGHDEPKYKVSFSWLRDKKNKLWIHCKNIQALYYFSSITEKFNFFWHQQDDFTLTNRGYIWTYPGKCITPMSIMVMPEWKINNLNLYDFKLFNCYGVCSDFVSNIN